MYSFESERESLVHKEKWQRLGVHKKIEKKKQLTVSRVINRFSNQIKNFQFSTPSPLHQIKFSFNVITDLIYSMSFRLSYAYTIFLIHHWLANMDSLDHLMLTVHHLIIVLRYVLPHHLCHTIAINRNYLLLD